MKPREQITKKREELGYTVEKLAKELEISPSYLHDIEWTDDEMENNVDIRKIRMLSVILNISLLCLLDEVCPVCKHQSKDIEYDINVPELVKSKRKEKGLSVSELGDMVGVYDWAINKIEESPLGIDEFNVVMFKDLAKILEIPMLSLLGRKCLNCDIKNKPRRVR